MGQQPTSTSLQRMDIDTAKSTQLRQILTNSVNQFEYISEIWKCSILFLLCNNGPVCKLLRAYCSQMEKVGKVFERRRLSLSQVLLPPQNQHTHSCTLLRAQKFFFISSPNVFLVCSFFIQLCTSHLGAFKFKYVKMRFERGPLSSLFQMPKYD